MNMDTNMDTNMNINMNRNRPIKKYNCKVHEHVPYYNMCMNKFFTWTWTSIWNRNRSIWVYKNPEFYADFQSEGILHKKWSEKNNLEKLWTKSA